MYRAVFTQDGFFGVDGPNFDTILLVREILETALQTHQAYRTSLLVPRKCVNRIFAALLVLNCWTTALVHSCFHENAVKRRLVALACDSFLDFVSSMGINMILVAAYIPDFDFSNYGFPYLKWYEDNWRVNAMSEFQMLFVASWVDIILRLIFALSMLGNLNNMKKLMRVKPVNGSEFVNCTLRRGGAVVPFDGISSKFMSSVREVDRHFLHYWIDKIRQTFFLLWGFIVLALHLYAEIMPELSQCTMQVKPWWTSRASCSLLELNCYRSGFSGDKADIMAQWSLFDPSTVMRVVIRHCPSLEIPVTLTHFVGLKELKIYNSTISNWDNEAAIAQSYHPELTTLFLVRVDLPNGELPLGLLAEDFPQSIEDIELCVTNLHSLPENLDMIWPQYASIYLEACQFEQVPPSLVRLAPFDLSLSLNPISTIPKELFESETIAYLNFGGTLISVLPEEVLKLAQSVYDINLRDTSISFFWSWIDPLAIIPTDIPWVSAGSTPYCIDLQRIFDKQQEDFSVLPPSRAEASILQNASIDNWAVISNAISCEKLSNLWYPLEFEDEYSKIV
ncbi:uncharacterized protein PHALS_04249 [Plasmopara halstedii]|uniref:Uncharacterized protein n=1 Tax=Plasmopara halstedii TaxID=4781 RepID=A0A0P1AZV2_PLAHL|nr:uncharacterized protein PHALS_04249 [Plasmopara halstedii]CEG47369.1 hypothetical protein PHALS_04249 [Plasmopara halstedii]|eukprot:XP_024583738.1 hypothetical protein PHALS_04249 [Plasmopara halstedii]